MSRVKDALRFSIFAIAVQAPAVLVYVSVWDPVGKPVRDIVLSTVFLSVAGGMAAFLAALIVVHRGQINSIRRGIVFGILAAGLFYSFCFLLFAVIPAVATVTAGRSTDVPAFLLRVVVVIVSTSRGLPLGLGLLGGAVYGALKSRRR